MRLPLALLLALISAALLVSVAAAQSEEDSRLPQGSSVGDGLGKAPAIAAAVKRTAKSGSCSVRAFASGGVQHGAGPFSFKQTPATSGTHASRWADWGVYEEVVPQQFQVHNLEHGGVVVHIGASFPQKAVKGLGEFFAREPGYLLVVPRATTKLVPAESGAKRFPEGGIVATSWQRRIVCRRATPKAMSAVYAYVRRYRGTGPEQVPAGNSSAVRPNDLPEPSLAADPPPAS